MRRIMLGCTLFLAISACLFAGDADPVYARVNLDDLKQEYAKGPNGEEPTPMAKVVLSDADRAAIKEKGYKAALLWAGSGTWYNALTAGAKAEFDKMGIKVTSIADANFDPAKQATDAETAMAANPDIILTLAVDPVSANQAFRPVVDANKVLVFVDNGVTGYEAGREYVGICTGDHYGMGRQAAKLMNDALNGKGDVGFIYHDADYFVTNNRDAAFKYDIENKYPGLKIVASQGFTEEPKTEEVAAAMLVQNPSIKGIYVAWDVAAEGVVAALRAAGRDDVKVVTHDLGANLDLDMAMDGITYGKVADLPYDIGGAMVRLAALKLLGKPAPSFVVAPSIMMTKDNIEESWKKSLGVEPSDDILKALGKK